MTIIVGRGRSKATQRIDISDPTVSREHCWITGNDDGTYTLENKSPQGTFVDGRQILKTRVTLDTYIKLSETTTIKVADLIPQQEDAEQAPQTKPHIASQNKHAVSNDVAEYSILHLKGVWDEYHTKQLEIQKKQRNINLLRSASPMFTLGSGTIATLAKTLGWGDSIFGLTIIMTIIGMGLMVYSFIKGFNDKSIEERERATELFTRDYICPNPDCNHFMGNLSYHIIRQNKNCPWCKCKYNA